MGDLNAAGQVAGQDREGSPAPAPGTEGGGVQGGAQEQNAGRDGDHLAGVLSRIREGRFHANDEAMLRRWQQGSTERDGFAERVQELEGKAAGLKAWADRLMRDVPIEDQQVHRAYREDEGDEAYIQARLAPESSPEPSTRQTQQTPPEETEEQRIARLVREATKEAVSEQMRPFLQRVTHDEFGKVLEKELAALDVDDKARAYLRKDVETHAQIVAREIVERRRPNQTISEVVPGLIKQRAAALKELLSAHGETVKTELVSKSEPKEGPGDSTPGSPTPRIAPEKAANMTVEDYWNDDESWGNSPVPAEGGAG